MKTYDFTITKKPTDDGLTIFERIHSEVKRAIPLFTSEPLPVSARETIIDLCFISTRAVLDSPEKSVTLKFALCIH